jgi:hypothetical protein
VPAIRRVVYRGPLDAVDVPSVGLFGVKPGEPIKLGDTAAEAVLSHPDFADADAKPAKASKSTTDTAQEA